MPHPEPITVARVGKLRSVRKVGRWESNPPEVEWVSHKKTWFWCLKYRNKSPTAKQETQALGSEKA